MTTFVFSCVLSLAYLTPIQANTIKIVSFREPNVNNDIYAELFRHFLQWTLYLLLIGNTIVLIKVVIGISRVRYK